MALWIGAMSRRKTSYSQRQVARAALGTHGFVGHTPELLKSPAWRSTSIHLRRVIDRLELEHLAHAGKENGHLCVTYNQFVQYGVGRRFIRAAIDEGVRLGLIRVTHQGGYRGTGRTDASQYRLTYLASKFVPATGSPEYHEPTNDWRYYVKKIRSGPRDEPPQKPSSSAPRVNRSSAPWVNYGETTESHISVLAPSAPRVNDSLHYGLLPNGKERARG